MTKRVGVVLSGCGYLDGAEVHEATSTLLALDRRGAEVVPLAPELTQLQVVDHRTEGQVPAEQRHVMAEAARIFRGPPLDLATVKAEQLDALILPGGYGAAKNLSNFASAGAGMEVIAPLARLIRDLRAAGKPMGFICIAPVIAAKVLGRESPTLTVGNDRDTIAALEALGAKHVERKVNEVAVDERLKLVSTPAYMLGPSIAPVFEGIDKLVSAVLELA